MERGSTAARDHSLRIGKLLYGISAITAPGRNEDSRPRDRCTALYNDAIARRILADVMKVQAPDDKVWEEVLSELMRTIPYYPLEARDNGWKRFWVRLRQAPEIVRGRFIQHHRNEIYVRRRNGAWVMADDILLPGALIEPDDTSANQNILVDDGVHGGDGVALAAVGVTQIPEGDIGPDYYNMIDGVAVSLADG